MRVLRFCRKFNSQLFLFEPFFDIIVIVAPAHQTRRTTLLSDKEWTGDSLILNKLY